jgi:HTH-type transcriptional regulator/antitoxin HipB
MDAKQIGKMVRYHRKKSGMTQGQLSKLAQLGKTVVFDIEKGKLSVKLNTLLKLLDVLNIKVDFRSPLMHLFEQELLSLERPI